MNNLTISMKKERWYLSTNAKDIGILYFIFSIFSGLIGTAFSVIIRSELSAPGIQYIADYQLYNSVITSHAILMIFFMVMPAMIGGFGNFLLPLLVGGPDMAKQRDYTLKTQTQTTTQKQVQVQKFFFISNKPYINVILFFILIVLLFILYKNEVISNLFSFIGSFLFTGCLILLYIDNFKFSSSKLIRYIQILSIFFIPLLYMYYLFNLIELNTVNCLNEDKINLHGHVSLDEKGAKNITQGISTIGSNIGLGASITGVYGKWNKYEFRNYFYT